MRDSPFSWARRSPDTETGENRSGRWIALIRSQKPISAGWPIRFLFPLTALSGLSKTFPQRQPPREASNETSCLLFFYCYFSADRELDCFDHDACASRLAANSDSPVAPIPAQAAEANSVAQWHGALSPGRSLTASDCWYCPGAWRLSRRT